MKFDESTQHYTLSTGRTFYAYSGHLNPADEGGLVYGSDGGVRLVDAEGDDLPLTPEERKEVAAHMIARWLAWAGALPAGCTLHAAAPLETCPDCPRVDLHVNVSLTRGAVSALLSKGGAA